MKLVRLLLACGLLAALLAPSAAQARLQIEGDVKAAKQLAKASSRKALGRNEKFIWPASGEITTQFGSGHAGIDIDGLFGDKIVAARGGTVTFAGEDGDGYGTKVIITHPGGLKSLYSHLSSIAVDRGPIARGDLVGGMGCTGSCTGDHLHFEILRGGTPTNPLDYLP